MSFIQRELDRINGALLDPANADVYDRLYAAQQALAWATEPSGFRSAILYVPNPGGRR